MRTLLTRLLMAALPVLVACSDTLTVDEILGPYTATTLTVQDTAGGPVIDALGQGASLEMTLFANGTTTGTLSVPASLNNGTPLLESLTGTFTFSGTTVTFDQAADTFIRDATWSADGRVLVATFSDGSGEVHVVLTRT